MVDELYHPWAQSAATGDGTHVVSRCHRSTPCRPAADMMALVTATNSGFPVPERDDAAQPGSAESSSPKPALQRRRQRPPPKAASP